MSRAKDIMIHHQMANLKAELIAERARREKAEAVVDWVNDPVAYRNPETGHVCSREKWESMGSSFRQGMRQPLYAAPEVKENDD